MKYLKVFEEFDEDPFEKQLTQDLGGQEEYQKVYYELADLTDPLSDICQILFKNPEIKFEKTTFCDSINFTYNGSEYRLQQYFSIIGLYGLLEESEIETWDADSEDFATIANSIIDEL